MTPITWHLSAHALRCAVAFGVAAAVAAAPTPPRTPRSRPLDPRVVSAALSTYMHGMTPELAESAVGRAGIPTLRALLKDPTFPRRDNVMAFLACLEDASTTPDVIGFLRNPPGRASIPEEDRALLLAPEALGRIAARGDRPALDALLFMTAPGSDGDVLALAARAGDDPDAYLGDLMVAALRGLAQSKAPEAYDRLVEIAAGRNMPLAGPTLVRGAAEDALALMADLRGGLDQPGTGEETDLTDGPGPVATRKAMDAQTRHHEIGFTYANHVGVTNVMTDARLDQVLAEANLRVGRADTATDVSCCVEFRRTSEARAFGAVGDGLDVIDTSAELSSVLNNSTARFKVVRQINYCGSAGTNIIGCGWRPGNGIAVVRLSGLGTEAVLWIHEYGHNAGRAHSTLGTRYVMYGVDYGTNDSLDAAECGAYHAPATQAAMTPSDIGTCGDSDGDTVVNLSDNCPDHANATQADADLDGIGDACDGLLPVCGNGVREGSEQCDGTDLGGQTCQGLGWDGGALACSLDCTLDASACADNPPPPPPEPCPDADLDGYQAASCNPSGIDGGGDCNDQNAGQRPGLREICGDGIDQDCNGSDKRCPRR